MDLKICGATTLTDIEILQQEGARYVGLWTGIDGHRRNLPDDDFVTLTNACDGLMPIAVCVKKPVAELCKLLQKTPVKHVQLHGFNPPKDIEYLKRHGFIVIKTLHVEETGTCPIDRLVEPYKNAGCDVFLIDRFGGGNDIGSSGKSLQAGVVQHWIDRLQGQRIWLAGGLTTDRIADLSETSDIETVDVDTAARRFDTISRKATRLLAVAAIPSDHFRRSA